MHPFSPGWRMLSGLVVAAALVASAVIAAAAPFRVDAPDDMRADGRLEWSAFSAAHGTVVPNWTGITAAESELVFTVVGGEPTTMTVTNPGGLPGGGVALASTGPGGVYVFSPQPLQGIGFWIASTAVAGAVCQIDYFGTDGVYFGSVWVTAPGGAGEPVFLGVVDPAARIGAIGIHATPGDALVISAPVFQLPAGQFGDYASLPVVGQETLTVRPTVTYLHEGLKPLDPSPATADAVLDERNAHDLHALFPTLRAGDVLHFERLGLPLLDGRVNHVAAVFAATPELGRGQDLRRVPEPVEAGADVYTEPSNAGPFATPTNIPEDFRVGESTFVSVPEAARYLLLSLATPSMRAGPVSVRVSHLRREALVEWLATMGLHGARASLTDDLDGDGLTLLEEFAFQKDPTVADARPDAAYAFAPKLDPTMAPGGPLALLFGARLNAPLRYRAEFSSDLVNWQEADASAVEPLLVDGQGDRALFRLLDPLDGSPRFARLRIEYVPPTPAPAAPPAP